MTPIHPAAELFPLMDDDALIELATDIKENGLHEPIVLLNSAILDGRNRARACDLLGIAPATKEWCGNGTPEAYVVSKNLHRRHLNESQRALIGARIATRKREDTLIPGAVHKDRSLDVPIGISNITIQQAADMLNVGKQSISRARHIISKGWPEDIAAIEQGKASVFTVSERIKQNSGSGKPPLRRGDARPAKDVRHDKDTRRNRTRRLNADLWRALRGALEGINGLPAPVDVAQAIQQYKRHIDITRQTQKAASWLKQFAQVWGA